MRKFSLDIQETIAQLLAQEDTDNDKRITIDDNGLKRFELKNQLENIVIEPIETTSPIEAFEEPTFVEEFETEEVTNFAEMLPMQTQDLEIYEEPSTTATQNEKPTQDELFAKLQNYKKLLDNGLIMQGEYDAFKKEILSQM